MFAEPPLLFKAVQRLLCGAAPLLLASAFWCHGREDVGSMSGACRNSSDNGPGVCSCCAGREMGSGMTWGHSQLPGRGAAPLVCWGQNQPAPCCRAGLLPREGSLPVRLGSHAGSSSTKSITHGSPPGAPPASSRPRSAWCNSRSRSRSSRCWDAARQEPIPFTPLSGCSPLSVVLQTLSMTPSLATGNTKELPPVSVGLPPCWTCGFPIPVAAQRDSSVFL